MKLTSTLRTLSIVSLVCIFLVILAGSVVRMTGSGMGCPDWPKCYGYMIPPSDAQLLEYTPGRTYEAKQMVILNDTLWVANQNFAAPIEFDHAQWYKYPKHNYARFDVSETWIEYINRLIGALSGLPILLLFVLSFVHMIEYKDVFTFVLATATLVMLGFEAWLGKVVVDGNLKVDSITLHMLGSMAIVALLTTLIFRLGKKELFPAFNTNWRWLAGTFVVMATLQILLGTQVREFVDSLAKGTNDRSIWSELLPVMSKDFKIHRSFSLLVVIVTFLFYRWNKQLIMPLFSIKVLIGLVAGEVLVGITLAYLNMPALMQPVHLLFAIGMFAVSFYIALVVFRRQVVV
jgi:cytochrome c oxidase assembly protein subunit 15